jgi:phage tail sheath protein FI
VEDGALAGSKPEEAYYVSVGLKQNNVCTGYFEGRMNIEIGMAAVRPAEFIVFVFHTNCRKHKINK